MPRPAVLAGDDLQHPVAQILTRRESAACSSDDDGAHRRVGGDVVHRERERAGERLVERVEHPRPVERDDRERTVALEPERPVVHLPLKLGLRLFTKASTPSFLSSVAKRT